MLETYFAVSLGAYDTQEAVETLPAQLELLRTLRDLERPDVALVYRLQTIPEPGGELGAQFRVLCVGRQPGALSPAEQQSLLDQIAVALLPAWGLQHGSEKPLPRAAFRARLDPLTIPVRLPIKADWSPLVDLLRRRADAMTVDWVCSSAADVPIAASLDIPSGLPVLDADHQLDAARFFVAATATDEHGLAPLSLRVLVHANEPIDDVLSRSIGRFALGTSVSATRIRRNILFPLLAEPPGITGPPGEIIRLFHGPYGPIQGRGLDGSRPTRRPIRFSVSESAEPAIGTGVRQGARGDQPVPVHLEPLDRLKHMYVLGKTGSGKTNLLKNMVRQDIATGRGVAVIDPHGDLVDYALEHASKRLDEVIYLDFGDPDFVPVINPLVVDVESAADRDLAITEVIDVLVRRTASDFTGPVFEDCVRMFLNTVSTKQLRTLVDTPTVAVGIDLLRSTAGRKWAQAILASEEPELAQEWSTFNTMGGNDISEHVRWVTSKFTDFGPEGILGLVTSGPPTPLSFTSLIADGHILLVKLPEAVIGPRAAGFLGSLIFSRIHRAALGSSRPPVDPFYLHVDEFQKFVSADVEGLVAEARKFGLSLTLAHQNLRQLDAFSRFEGNVSIRLREAIFSNVGTIACLKTAGNDVSTLATELGVSDRDVRRIGQYEALVRGVVEGVERDAFTLQIPDATSSRGDSTALAKVRKRMIDTGHWRGRDDLQQAVDDALRTIKDARKATGAPPPSPTFAPTASTPGGFAEEFRAKRARARGDGADPRRTRKDAEIGDKTKTGGH